VLGTLSTVERASFRGMRQRLAARASAMDAVASACDVVSEVSAPLEPDVSAGGLRSVRRRSARRRAAEPSHTRHRF